jgi:hypothetical protein
LEILGEKHKLKNIKPVELLGVIPKNKKPTIVDGTNQNNSS